MTFTRREFVAGALSAVALAKADAPLVLSKVPRDKFRTALIGSGWWGKNILKEAMEAGRSKVVALCDVDAQVLETSAEFVKNGNGDAPKTYPDFRELLEKEKPEIVIIATPDQDRKSTRLNSSH